MPIPHLIRLRGPWERTVAGSTARISLPGDWLMEVANEANEVVFSRQFNCPTNLEPGAVVQLCWSDLPAESRISLNGEHLPHSALNIMPLLKTRNRVEIVMAANSPRPVKGEVWLAI